MNDNTKLLPTLAEAFETYIADRRDLRDTSVYAYRCAFGRIPHDLANRRLDEIKFSDLKRMYLLLRYDKGDKPRSIALVSSTINPLFTIAVQDELITRNPNEGALRAAAKGDAWKKTRRTAVTEHDQKLFMQYIHSSDRFFRWENFFVFMFGTGCRVGEAIGLQWKNVDFENNTISIDHTIEYVNKQLVTHPPKSEAGYRTIPMLKDVKIALQKELVYSQIGRPSHDSGNEIDKNDYVFKSKSGTVIRAACVNYIIKEIVKAYNLENLEDPISDFSIHQTRHSFTSRLVENNINIKVVQEVLGHADISTTLDVYAEVSEDKKSEEFKKLEGKKIV